MSRCLRLALVSWEESEWTFRSVGRGYVHRADELLYEHNKNSFDNLGREHASSLVIVSITGVENQESENQMNSRLKFKEILKGKSRYERINLAVQPADAQGTAVFEAYEKEGAKFFEPKSENHKGTGIKIAKTALENYELLIEGLKNMKCQLESSRRLITNI